MEPEFSKQEKEFFKRIRNDKSKPKIFRMIAIVIIFLLGLGIILDALNDFRIFRENKFLPLGVLGLLLLAVFYLLGEGVGERINTRDHVSHPLYKRVFHLLLLLISAGTLMTLAYYLFTYLGWNL